MQRNLILNTDSYKFTHWRQNPPGTEHKSSYIEARGGAWGYTVFFGLQAFLKEYLSKPIVLADVMDAAEIVTAHMGRDIFDREGWIEVIRAHNGRLPVTIEAVPEGMPIPHGTPMVQVRNTDRSMPWLPAFLETAILRAVWYPSTVATLSREIKQTLKRHLDKTCETPDLVLPYMLHDFGARGVSSLESAGLGGLAHLVNFRGTDTIEALLYARKYYGEAMAGTSIPASEHSTVTCWGKDREVDFVRHMMKEFGGAGKLLAVVGDSFDIFNFTGRVLGEELKAEIIAMGGRLVERPDSGDPVEVISEVMRLNFLAHGGTRNAKGYDVLPPYIRVIQGDGVDENSIDAILTKLAGNKISAENICFGMGGALLQKVNRDTCRFAMKTSAAKINGEWVEVSKKPITDKGKTSKAGWFDVVQDSDGHIVTLKRPMGNLPVAGGLLRKVWENGELLVDTTFAEVRERAK